MNKNWAVCSGRSCQACEPDIAPVQLYLDSKVGRKFSPCEGRSWKDTVVLTHEAQDMWRHVSSRHIPTKPPLLWLVPTSVQFRYSPQFLSEVWGPWRPVLLILPLVSSTTPTGLAWHSTGALKEEASCPDYFEILCCPRLSTDSTSLLPLTSLVLHYRQFTTARKAWVSSISWCNILKYQLLCWSSCQWERPNPLPEDSSHPWVLPHKGGPTGYCHHQRRSSLRLEHISTHLFYCVYPMA